MITLATALTQSDGDLMAAATRLAAEGRQVTADLIALLAVLVERKLYAGEGYGSAHDFCVGRLRLSDAQAYHRLAAAHVAWRVPSVLDRLRAGKVTLTTVALLRPHLTEENAARVLDWAEGRGKREVEAFVRGLAPRPEVTPSLRRLDGPRSIVTAAADRTADRPAAACEPAALPAARPSAATTSSEALGVTARTASQGGPVAPSPLASPSASLLSSLDRVESEASRDAARQDGRQPSASSPAASAPTSVPPAPRAEIRALTPTRYSLRMTIGEETRQKLLRALDLLQHAVPTRDAAEVLDRALTLLVAHLERAKFAATKPTARTVTRREAGRRAARRSTAAARATSAPPTTAAPPSVAPASAAAPTSTAAAQGAAAPPDGIRSADVAAPAAATWSRVRRLGSQARRLRCLERARGTSPRPCDGPCGRAMAGNAAMSGLAASAAPAPAGWSSITACRSPRAARPRSRTWRSSAAFTMVGKPRAGSARILTGQNAGPR